MLQVVTSAKAWRTFSGTNWQGSINVRDFIVSNITPYTGGPEFLAEPTKRTGVPSRSAASIRVFERTSRASAFISRARSMASARARSSAFTHGRARPSRT